MSLVACGSQAGGPGTGTIECRLDEEPDFARVCTIEKMASPDGTILILHRPDGGFHRVQVVKDGRGVVAADGAVPVQVRQGPGASIDVDVGDGVYRLAAKVTP